MTSQLTKILSFAKLSFYDFHLCFTNKASKFCFNKGCSTYDIECFLLNNIPCSALFWGHTPYRVRFICTTYTVTSRDVIFRYPDQFFHESVSPRPPSIPLKPFWIFSKIHGDIRELMFITGVNNTGEQFIFPRWRWCRSEKNQKA